MRRIVLLVQICSLALKPPDKSKRIVFFINRNQTIVRTVQNASTYNGENLPENMNEDEKRSAIFETRKKEHEQNRTDWYRKCHTHFGFLSDAEQREVVSFCPKSNECTLPRQDKDIWHLTAEKKIKEPRKQRKDNLETIRSGETKTLNCIKSTNVTVPSMWHTTGREK